MLRNDYSRKLILLRGHRKGVSGHLRLTRRTLSGSMQLVASGVDDAPLHAVLIAGAARNWRAHRLGGLRGDGKGQAFLTTGFDPRNIAGLELDDYVLIGVVRCGRDATDLILSGFTGGSREVDWGRARESAENAVGGARNAARAACGGENIIIEEAPAEAPEETAETPEESVPEEAVPEEAVPEEAVPEEAVPEETPEEAVPEEAVPEEAAEEVAPEEAPERAETAGERLGIDMEAAWPDCIESLRELFKRSAAAEPFAADELDGFVFVVAPLPEGGECAVGIHASGASPDKVCYAVPGAYAQEPPAGLEGYCFLRGAEKGWWLTVLDAAEA